MVLWPKGGQGIQIAEFVFADRDVGTSSSMSSGMLLVWHPTDPQAQPDDMVWEWSGTVVVASWSDDRVEIDLVDGQRCPLYETVGCTASGGRMVIDGERRGPTSGESTDSWFTDVATGEPLCNYPRSGFY